MDTVPTGWTSLVLIRLEIGAGAPCLVHFGIILTIYLLINHVLALNMGDHATKSESEVKVSRELDILPLERLCRTLVDQISAIEERVIRMERAYDALGRRLEGSERHVEDEGWFD